MLPIVIQPIFPPPPSRSQARPAYAIPPPTSKSVDYEQQLISSEFDSALAVFERGTSLKVKYPSLSGWLKSLYNYSQSERARGNSWYDILYPTSGQNRPIVDDEPTDADRTKSKPQTSLAWRQSSPITYVPEFPFREWYNKTMERIKKEILGKENIRYVHNDNFVVGSGVENTGSERAHAKIYGCLKARESPLFARRLADWSARNSGRVNLQGKFYELDSKNSHNKLCMYVDFRYFSEVATFLATEALDDFHPIDFNHPAGAHLAPGLSATIISGSGHFDEIIKDRLTEVPKSSEEEFIREATRRLTEAREIKHHFKWLAEKCP